MAKSSKTSKNRKNCKTQKIHFKIKKQSLVKTSLFYQ